VVVPEGDVAAAEEPVVPADEADAVLPLSPAPPPPHAVSIATNAQPAVILFIESHAL
jgi:hypothetical protein